eukprot:4351818-Lingulodinium_polyedra.AAC.1
MAGVQPVGDVFYEPFFYLPLFKQHPACFARHGHEWPGRGMIGFPKRFHPQLRGVFLLRRSQIQFR